MGAYVIALKKSHRGEAPFDLQAELARVQGLTVTGESRGRYSVIGSDEVISLLRSRFAGWCLIEPVVRHGVMSAQG
jgi:hypothetical protein